MQQVWWRHASKASSDLYSLQDPSIHVGQSFPYSYLETGSRRTIGASCTLSSSSSRNDAFRSFHWLPAASSDRPVYPGDGEWRKWNQPWNGAQADQLVHIPMPGRAESLNVAVAAGILMFSLRKFWEKEVYLTCKKKLMEVLLGEPINERWLSYAISSWQEYMTYVRPFDPAS